MKNSSRKLSRAGSAVALSLLALFVSSCVTKPAVDNVKTEAPTPTDQASVPAKAEVGSGANIDDLIGKTVTVSTKITEVISPNLFTVYDVESLRGEEVLAVTDAKVPPVGTNVEVTGEIMKMDEAAIKSAYNVTLEPKVVEAYKGKPYLAVKAIEPVD